MRGAIILAVFVVVGCGKVNSSSAQRVWRRVAHEQFAETTDIGQWFEIEAATWRVRWEAQQTDEYMVGRSVVLELASEEKQFTEPIADERWKMGVPIEDRRQGEVILKGPRRLRLMPVCYSARVDVFVEEFVE